MASFPPPLSQLRRPQPVVASKASKTGPRGEEGHSSKVLLLLQTSFSTVPSGSSRCFTHTKLGRSYNLLRYFQQPLPRTSPFLSSNERAWREKSKGTFFALPLLFQPLDPISLLLDPIPLPPCPAVASPSSQSFSLSVATGNLPLIPWQRHRFWQGPRLSVSILRYLSLFSIHRETVKVFLPFLTYLLSLHLFLLLRETKKKGSILFRELPLVTRCRESPVKNQDCLTLFLLLR